MADVAAKAHEKLPECNGRITSAVKMVLAGDVIVQVDGSALVGSQTDGSTTYHVANGHCDCKHFAKALHGFCKHRLSAAIARRAQELLKAQRDGTHNDHGERDRLNCRTAHDCKRRTEESLEFLGLHHIVRPGEARRVCRMTLPTSS